MSVEIIILPVITIPADWEKSHVEFRVRLPKTQAARLSRYGREWKMTAEEAAAAIIDQYFQSVRNR
jgi:hypothetical protein